MAWGLTATTVLFVPGSLPEWLQSSMMSVSAIRESLKQIGWAPPQFVGDVVWRLMTNGDLWLTHLSVIVPMGLFNVIGSLQNIESAEAGGDRYNTCASLAANGIGTIAAALFGSCFPTTIYIGHPGWKGLGARAGYSTLNGAVITALCLTGAIGLVSSLVPIEAGVAIVLWIGIVITSQAFSATKPEHAPAVAVGLFPAIAAWGMTVAHGAFREAGGETMQSILSKWSGAMLDGYLLHGLISMERGFIFTCMMLAAISAFLIDRRFFTAGWWTLVAATCAALGLTHAYQLVGNETHFLFALSEPIPGAFVYRADPIAVGYALMAVVFFAFGAYQRSRGELVRVEH